MSAAKRVLIYSEYWATRGGGEKYLLCVVETLLQAGYDVTIVAQTASFDKDAVARYFHVDITDATVLEVEGGLQRLRSEAERLSHRFDICFYMTNYRYFPSHARQTFVILQTPYGPVSTSTILQHALRGKFKESTKEYYRRKLLTRLRETHAVLVYSRFVHDSLDILHNIPSTILEPAIDDFHLEETPKERVVLSVGRFFRGLYNDKRHDILIEAFKRLYAQLPNTTWQYRLVGSCGDDAGSRRYLDELRASASGLPVYFHVNTPYEDLRRLYNEATLFWHAAGFGVNESEHPERAEHFGMSTLEAMSARCVPLVINRGGQKEIVSHGKSGYLWNSVDELVGYSLDLIADSSRLAALQASAQERFADFTRVRFAEKLLTILNP